MNYMILNQKCKKIAGYSCKWQSRVTDILLRITVAELFTLNQPCSIHSPVSPWLEVQVGDFSQVLAEMTPQVTYCWSYDHHNHPKLSFLTLQFFWWEPKQKTILNWSVQRKKWQQINCFKEIWHNNKAACCQCHILFSGLKEHGNLSFDVRLPEDKFDIRPVFGSLTQHALDQFSQLGIVPTGHLWQLVRKTKKL